MSITKKEIGTILNGATKAPLDRDSWIQQGFPESLVSSFLATAEMTKTAVLTRVPGQATTQLIKEKNDLKGFFIKAKSCDWGPMAGFLCRNPAFNKKGVKGIDYNIKYLLNYKNDLESKFQNGSSDDAFRSRAFVPLRISDDRKKQFLGDFSEDSIYNFEESKRPIESEISKDDSSERIYGLVSSVDKDGDTILKSVVMEFMMEKKVENGDIFWLLYHGYVYIKKTSGGNYEEYPIGGYIDEPKSEDKDKIVKFKTTLEQQKSGLTFTDQQKNNLTTWLRNKFSITRGALVDCYSIDGIQNPYPPYKDPESYKNTVTGDYDLFSVWPVLPQVGFADLIRVSELELTEDALLSQNLNFDLKIPVSTHLLISTVKKFTLELTRSRNIYLEFILPGNLLKDLESQYFGNIHEAGFYVAQMLNSLNSVKVNAAFHSDEGGRPNVDEIDYPIAVFLPTAIAAKLKEQTKSEVGPALIVNTHKEFLCLIEALYQKCYITLNHGWMLHLFALIQEDSLLSGQGDKKKNYFANRLAEKGKLSNTEFNIIYGMLENLFARHIDDNDSIISGLSFEKLKETFWDMLINTDSEKTPEYWKKILSREEVETP